jgi:diguanylate cyclase (GGDEF)-like protein
MGRGFTMLMLDLDDLKPVNDTFGHQWGDRLLKAIADTIRRTIRFTDAAARYGGDEFVVLLPETDAAGGYVVGEKLRRDIYALTLHAADRNVRSSVSIGMVAYPDDGATIEQLVAAADVAMYEAKRRGKNRIVGYQTRTERIATDIDEVAEDLVQLTPADDVRTGGDPVPWGLSPPDAGARVYYGDPMAETPLRPPSRRQGDRSAIPVEPDEDVPPPWIDDPGSRSTPGYHPDRGTEPRTGSRPPEPPPEPPEPPAPPRAQTAVEAPEQPWLTRTSSDAPPPRAGEQPPKPRSSPPQRPSAEYRLIDGERSRTDEIRRGSTGDRPWIALPIEPEDQDEPPTR